LSLLSVANKYEMHRTKERAVCEIDKVQAALDPVDRWLLAREHDVPEWESRAFDELVNRAAMLSIEDSDRMGAQATCRVYRQRELNYRGERAASPTPPRELFSISRRSSLEYEFGNKL
jgi:hypothetical protein